MGSSRQRIVMIGTSLQTRGGISAVVRVYEEEGFLARHGVCYIGTHVDGSKWRKLRTAAWAWLRYMRLLLTAQVALLHVHSASGPSFWRKAMFIVPTQWLRVPVVLHWHGGGFVAFHERCTPWQKAWVARVFRRCERVVALSDQWRQTLEQLVPGIHVEVISNAVRIPPRPSPLQGEPPAVLFLGQVSQAKGVFDLLRAWPRVLAAVPGARLRIAGSGDLALAQCEAAALGIEASVDWLGWIGAEHKATELRNAWLVALPSYAEGVPMALLEAQAAGVPVVSTRVGGIPLAVRDGVDGVLLPPGDPEALAQALRALLLDAPRRIAMGADARKRMAAQFGPAPILLQLETLWAGLLTQPAMQEPR